MANVDYDKAARLLAALFAKAEEAFHQKQEPAAAVSIRRAKGGSDPLRRKFLRCWIAAMCRHR